MNERIQKLAEQALNEYTATYHNEAKIPEAYLEKFSELIVKECLAKAEEEAELYRGFPHLGGAEYAKVMHNYQLLLKEYFGVEE